MNSVQAITIIDNDATAAERSYSSSGALSTNHQSPHDSTLFAPQVTLKAMSVTILLDKPHTCFTNLDFISGRVILQIPYNETIAAIVVKLEGESKTRLMSYVDPLGYPSARGHSQLEIHKVSEYSTT